MAFSQHICSCPGKGLFVQTYLKSCLEAVRNIWLVLNEVLYHPKKTAYSALQSEIVINFLFSVMLAHIKLLFFMSCKEDEANL